MFEAKEVKKNTVSAREQLQDKGPLQFYDKENAKKRILFVGNSITYHGPNAEIGWNGSWGMAASSEEKDYVHQTVSMLEEKYGTIGFAIAQAALWEIDIAKDTIADLKKFYQPMLEFPADLVVIRLGENVPGTAFEQCDVEKRMEEMVTFFAGDAKQVIVTDNFWRREQLDLYLEGICKRKGYTFCRISDLYEDKATMALGQYEHEGVALHPSDYGMKLIAERIVEKVLW